MMTILRRAVLVCLFLPIVAFAQSADQEVVSAIDSPDPVTPGGALTYTVTLTNHGPDPATGGGVNINLPLSVTHVSSSGPGFTCNYLGHNGTCNMASLPVGTYVITINVTVNASLASFPDTNISANFFPSGTTIDPNNANNSKMATTAVDSPQVDLSIAVTDSPDPVFPDGNVTYSGTVTQGGPDDATTVNLNVVPNSSLAFQSATFPAGWNCVLPSVGALNATFTCSRPTWAPGADNFTVVFSANDENFGIIDTPFQTYFGVNAGASNETDHSDNDVTVTTQYTTPDADMNITVSDSPDPVSPDGDITYTVTVTNQGPDPATNARMTIVGNGGQTRFVSLIAPGGWTCNPPAAGTLLNVAGYDCTIASLANGASAVFTVVTEASDDLHPNSDHNITQMFTAYADEADPDGTDNSWTETTLYDVSNADISVTNSDSPDPVSPGDTITYAQSITNNGPDTAANATFTQSTPAGTTFQSFTAPAGWSCATPAAGATGAITCTKPSMTSGESGAFTLVVNVTGTGTITSTVTGGSDASDSVPDNTAQTTTTSIGAAAADLGITKTTSASTAPEGSTITYTIVLTNDGPDAAANVEMTDTLPASLLFRSITTPAGFACTTPAVGATGTIACGAATLANGASATFTLVVEVATSSGTISNTATATSDTADGNSGNDGGTAGGVIAEPAEADLEIAKTTGTASATPGETIAYTITVNNAGPSPATNVVVTDDLPAGLAFVSATPSQGTCNASDPVSCNLGTIFNGGSATITLTAQVTATSGTIANTASVTSTEGDTDSSTTAPIPVGSAEVAAIPTASEWGLMMMMVLLGALAVWKMRS